MKVHAKQNPGGRSYTVRILAAVGPANLVSRAMPREKVEAYAERNGLEIVWRLEDDARRLNSAIYRASLTAARRNREDAERRARRA